MSARAIDPRRFITHAGVAVFGLSLLIPSLVSGVTHSGSVIVAALVEAKPLRQYQLPLPDPVARTRLAPEPAPPPPTPAPTSPAPPIVASGEGHVGVVYMASWYGPGFYENRLPCWRWLEANRQPIQLTPDTWGIAHKTLPCGTMVTLIHGANVVMVPVVDRGPYVEGREFDLAPRVKAALGCTDLCAVVMQIR